MLIGNDTSVRRWVEEIYKVRGGAIEELYTSKIGLDFLIVWSIFETECFGKFMKVSDIEKICNKLEEANITKSLQKQVEHFHSRYQDKGRLKHLVHKQENEIFKKILEKATNDLEEKDKLYLLIYVVYRYRNNMFHGNKGVRAWLYYTKEIQYCITIMQRVVDTYLNIGNIRKS